MSQPPCGGRGSGVRPMRERGGDTDLVRVLLVDDEERMVTALRRGLTAEGFVTESAGDGLTGLALARDGDFDAVVLDVMLPGISGYEVVRRLRAEDNWVPVLMLSAKDGEYDQADALDDGADDYLTSNAGRVVAKIELIDHVWDSAAEVTLNTVEVYAGYLRRKIGSDRLSTVRGVGYRLPT